MPVGLQKQVDTLESRTDSLEVVLGQFISSMNKFMTRREADTKAFRDEVRADTKKLKDEMKEFKDEMKEFKNEMKDFKDEMNKRLGKLSNKMGTLVEDMVAPNIPSIAREYFGDEDFDFFAIRIRKRNVSSPSIRREFDAVAVSEKNFFINETKSKPRPEDVRKFTKMLKGIQDYFPECKGKKIVPILSSLYFSEDLKKHLTRKGVYAMGLKEGTMDLLNFKQLSENMREE